MLDSEANKDNVNFLLKKLCVNILQEHDLAPDVIKKVAPKLKSKAYEILLKRSTKPHHVEDTNTDPQRALDVQIFSAKLQARGKPHVFNKVLQLEEHLKAIKEEEYFLQETGKGVLQLLLTLQKINIDKDNEAPLLNPPPLLIPGPFTLYANYENNSHYPAYNWDIMHQEPKHFKALTPLKAQMNPYLPKFLFENEPNLLQPLKSHIKEVNAKCNEGECTFTGMTKRLLEENSICVNNTLLGLPAKTQKKPESLLMPTSKPIEEENCSNILICQSRKGFSWNWESLGCFGVILPRPFVGEASFSMLLQSHVDKMDKKKTFEAKVLKLNEILQDLKSLCVGIQSDTFQHDEFIVFSMQPSTTVDGVLPDTLKYFVQDFLECGTCYKRMQTMIMKRDYKLMFEGFMFKALCSAVDEYLITFRQYVFAQHDEHLTVFSGRLKKMIKQLINLSYTLAIHPNVDANVKPPMGSQFLGYLYREIMRLTEKDYITLLVFILKRCCHVYLKNLQKWIYYGLLDDPCNELFIGFVDHYRQNTKYFYDKAYYIRKESVPGFFQNYENQILQCGKYIKLLKAFKPSHPLFGLEYPEITVCLSFKEIEKLKQTCAAYYQTARTVCTQPISIRQLFEKRSEDKRILFKKMVEKSRANLERWTDEQQQLASIKAEQKKKRFEELTNQLQDAKQKKIQDRKANVELELKYLREAEKLEEQRMLRDNINLRKRIEYYQELSDMMNETELSKDRSKRAKAAKAESATMQTPAVYIKTPQTPPSTSRTEFESCCGGEDDLTSVYEECISDDFTEKFSKCEKQLKIAYDYSEYTEQQQQQQQQQLKDAEGNLLNVGTDASIATLVPATEDDDQERCISDALNCNDAGRGSVNVVQQNRLKILSGSNVSECLMEPIINENTQKKDKDNNTQSRRNVIQQENLTEAQRNKIKMFKDEMFIDMDEFQGTQQQQPDVNLNTLPASEMTEFQRNRNRNVQNNLFEMSNKQPDWIDRTKFSLNLNTERARIRRKVLESEYDIVTGTLNNALSTTTLIITPTEILHESTTPMSTTSDDVMIIQTPTTSNTDTNTSVYKDDETDIENGNVCSRAAENAMRKSANFQLDVTLCDKEAVNDLPTAATFTEQTLESALNTAGCLSKQGFTFPSLPMSSNKHDKQQQQQQQNVFNEPPIHNESQEAEDPLPPPDYKQPYKRCEELLNTNFKCNTFSPYIRLNSPAKHKSNNLDLNHVSSISVVTLTEFLQKSLIIPMSTHLELINNEVMRLFLEDLRILDHFRSLRNYYFLMDGEFGAIICDGIIGKLEDGATPETLLNYQILHSILDTALGSSIKGHDVNAENLSFIVSDVPERFDLMSPDVLNTLSLSYRIKWPLNLILNPETLDQYGNVFKYLLRVRRISWILEKAFQILQDAVKRHGSDILKSPQYRHVQLIRHKFYHFVHALQNHITANALQASWKNFKDELLNANSIEAIYRTHATYIKRILFLCMLNKRSVEFYNTIENIFKISLRFYNNLKSREFKLKTGQTHFTHSRYEKLVIDEAEFDKFIKYTIYLGNKIVRHGYQEEIGEFISLINYNQYYLQNI